MASKANTVAYLGVGWAFPLAPVDGRLTYAAHETSVEQSIRSLLHTEPGERVMLPKLGAGLQRFVFEPNSPATYRGVEHAIEVALVDWEPRIDIIRIAAGPGTSPTEVRISIEYRVRATNTFYNRVYPFYLLEGGA